MESSAFVLGAALASLPPHLLPSVKAVIAPIRDFFIVLFFAAMGMLIHPKFIIANFFHICVALILICFVKFCILWICLIVANKSKNDATKIALGLSHVGEFGFILVAKGFEMGIISRHVYLLLIGVTAVSLVFTPLMLRMLSKYGPPSTVGAGYGKVSDDRLRLPRSWRTFFNELNKRLETLCPN